MNRFATRWDDFWFRPDTAIALARCRIGICLGLLYAFFYDPQFMLLILNTATFEDPFYFPLGLYKLISPPDIDALQTLHTALGVALVAAVLGFATRLALATACGLVFYMAIGGMYGKILSYQAVPILVLGILAMSPASHAVSIDRLIKRRFAWWPFGATDNDESGEYRWPVQFLRVFVCMVFFMAGLSKLLTSGIGWVTSDNLQILLVATPMNQGCIGSWPSYPELNAWIVQHPTLLHALAAGVLVTELAAPLALIPGITRIVMVTGFFALNIGFRIFMGPSFDELLVTYTFAFIPWERGFAYVARKVRSLRRSPPAA